MKTAGIVIAVLLTTVFLFLGKVRDPDFYLAAIFPGMLLFRLTTGSACPIVWLLSKLGVAGLSCPADYKKRT